MGAGRSTPGARCLWGGRGGAAGASGPVLGLASGERLRDPSCAPTDGSSARGGGQDTRRRGRGAPPPCPGEGQGAMALPQSGRGGLGAGLSPSPQAEAGGGGVCLCAAPLPPAGPSSCLGAFPPFPSPPGRYRSLFRLLKLTHKGHLSPRSRARASLGRGSRKGPSLQERRYVAGTWPEESSKAGGGSGAQVW